MILLHHIPVGTVFPLFWILDLNAGLALTIEDLHISPALIIEIQIGIITVPIVYFVEQIICRKVKLLAVHGFHESIDPVVCIVHKNFHILHPGRIAGII